MHAAAAPPDPPRAEPWYIAFGGQCPEDEPRFFEREEIPWLERIEAQWHVIREELERLLAEPERGFIPYFKSSQVSHPGRWKVFPFCYWGWRFRGNCRRCPKTAAIIRSIPGVTTGAFSALEPHTTIRPHVGDTNAIARCHLGLIVPAGAPRCGIKVGETVRGWEEGRFLVFSDANRHLAWNHTAESRYVLFVDVMRPQYLWQQRRVCRTMLLAVALSWIEARLPAFRLIKPALKALLFPIVQMRLPRLLAWSTR
jgi:aspartyl/asparaginyl beta-hydroxylase (cupin superfamily)